MADMSQTTAVSSSLSSASCSEVDLSGPSDYSSSSSSNSSLLARLRCPAPSDLSRKRKILANKPPLGKRRSVHTVKRFELKSIRPSDRASEFPKELLVQSAGLLFCKACREDVAVA